MGDRQAAMGPHVDRAMPEQSAGLPDPAREKYYRLALISDAIHLKDPRLEGADVLVMSTDWLAVQFARDQNVACVHFETALRASQMFTPNSKTHFIQSMAWLYEGDEDMSLVEGISIGSLIGHVVPSVAHAIERMWTAVEYLVSTYEPNEMLLFDVRSEFNRLDEISKVSIVAAIAEKHSLRFIDVNQRIDTEANFQNMTMKLPSPSDLWSDNGWLREPYCRLLDGLFRVIQIFRTRGRRVFLHHNGLYIDCLLESLQRSDVQPFLLASINPKQPADVLRYIRIGAALAYVPRTRLSRGEAAEVAACVARVIKAVDIRGDLKSPSGILADFIRRRLVSEGLWVALAEMAKSVRNMLRRVRPDRIVVGDSEAFLSRILLEAAAAESIPCDEFLNGMFMLPQKFDARSGTPQRLPLISRFLSWGLQNEAWILATGAGQPVVRVGNPVVRQLKNTARWRPSARRTALVLPLGVERGDMLGSHGQTIMYLVHAVRLLCDLGYVDVRVKVHHGPFNPDYIRRALRYFELPCEVYQAGPLKPHAQASELVVGPVNSGALLECLAMEKPYYPLVLNPTSLSSNLMMVAPVSTSIEELAANLKAGNAVNGPQTLERHASVGSISDPGQRFWEAMSMEEKIPIHVKSATD